MQMGVDGLYQLSRVLDELYMVNFSSTGSMTTPAAPTGEG
jgi:hypothetical protein